MSSPGVSHSAWSLRIDVGVMTAPAAVISEDLWSFKRQGRSEFVALARISSETGEYQCVRRQWSHRARVSAGQPECGCEVCSVALSDGLWAAEEIEECSSRAAEPSHAQVTRWGANAHTRWRTRVPRERKERATCHRAGRPGEV
jgi:hypothetical protein